MSAAHSDHGRPVVPGRDLWGAHADARAVPDEVIVRPTIDIYARLSRALNGETITVEDQVEQCTDKIHARGGRVGLAFTDNSKSAWNPKVIRKKWLLLMERLESGASDGVMVYDLYRFSRKIMEGERLLEAAQNGLRVWALSGEYDLMTADGRGHFREGMVAAARESDKTSERSRRGKYRSAKRGGTHGGPRAWAMPGLAPIGDQDADTPKWKVTRRTLETVERVNAEREIAKECIQRILDNEPVYRIVKDLNDRGDAGELAALPVSGKKWSNHTLNDSLCRPAIAGLVKYHGEAFGELADVDPVVDRALWERLVAKRAAQKTGRPPVDRHMLTGNLACGRCGTQFYALLRSGNQAYADGAPKRDYRCPSPNSNIRQGRGCGRNGIDARVAEQAVITAVTARLRDPSHAELLAEQMRETRDRRAEIVHQIHDCETTADDLANKTAKWGVARVDKAMEPILRDLAHLRQHLAEFDTVDQVGVAADDAIAEWEKVTTDGDVRTQRQIIHRVFPNLAVAPPAHYGDHSESRLLWDGPTDSPCAGGHSS